MVRDNLKYKEVISDCYDKIHFARQFISKEPENLEECASGIIRDIEVAESDIRVICLDAREYDDFADMMKNFLSVSFKDAKFQAEDTLVCEEDFVDENSESEICYQTTCLLEDFSMNGIYVLFIITNYDAVKEKWSSSNYGWIRGIVCDNQNLSVLLFSECSAEEVSKEPVGSSPFYNIIEVTRI